MCFCLCCCFSLFTPLRKNITISDITSVIFTARFSEPKHTLGANLGLCNENSQNFARFSVYTGQKCIASNRAARAFFFCHCSSGGPQSRDLFPSMHQTEQQAVSCMETLTSYLSACRHLGRVVINLLDLEAKLPQHRERRRQPWRPLCIVSCCSMSLAAFISGLAARSHL